MTIISGHQPAYLPWIGYFHKMTLCDIFIFMDDVQYIKKDWINRNRIKGPDGEIMLTVPISKCPTQTNIANVKINNKLMWQQEHWKTICYNYRKCLFFEEYAPIISPYYDETSPWESIADLCYAQLCDFIKILGITIPIIKASEYNFSGKKSNLILEHCTRFKADTVILGPKGRDYIVEHDFKTRNINLIYHDYNPPTYEQRFQKFIPGLSILDLIFNKGPNSLEVLSKHNTSKSNLTI